MDVFQSYMEAAIAFVREAPALLSLVALCLSAVLEYVFPPVPGDTFALVGGILAGQGALSVLGVVIALTIGSTIGGLLSFALGRAIATRPWARERFGRLLPDDRLAALETLFEKHGRWVVVANRFLPGFRAYVLIAAGIGKMRVRDVVVFGGLSALLWNAALVAAGVAVGENLELLLGWIKQYTVVVWGLLAVVALGVVVRTLFKRRKNA